MRTVSAYDEAAEHNNASAAATSGVNRRRVIGAPRSSDSHHEVQIRIDARLKPRRQERRGKRQLADRRSFDARARSETRVVVDVGVDESPLGTGEENFPTPLFRCGRLGASAARGLQAWLGYA